MSKIAAFEGLRGVLALCVCLGHFGLDHVLEKFGLHLLKQLAVFVFFALSGFVLSRAYYFGRRSFARLALSRVARLYPLHLATWLWGIALALATQAALDPLQLGMSLLLLHNLGLPGTSWSVNFPSWSISVEMALSLLFYAVATRRSVGLAAVLIVVGLTGAAAWASTDLDTIKTLAGINVGLLCGVAGFSIGVAAYILHRDHAQRFDLLRRFAVPLTAATLGFMLLPLGWFHAIGALFAAATLILLPVLAIADGTNFLASRPFVFLGAISYSLYLIHIPMLLTATALLGETAMRGPAPKLALLAVTLAASALCHSVFELPAQAAILRRLAPRPPQTAPT